ncbi:MAG: Vi polysaccharide biosynthesis UDP-N-acetylglucosamine C-6 dehydrogenase TviB, partial [Gammaproteobacteria bacterium]|nr:Vi polysaccharide biosynthesis UDP-N-acetylglucosamine C-6 dehydrogenase TviB [Gammaproteobacteria bacterium]
MDLENLKIGVIGLGYVGLPLVVELDRHFHTVGFDVKKERIAELKTGHDSTLEVDDADLKNAGELSFTT